MRQSPPPATSTPPNPLPGALPLAELVPLLEARARAGDGAAACRLGVELSKCRHMLRSLPTAPDEQMDETRWREQGRSDAQIASLRDQRRRRLHQRAACEALPPELIDRAPWFMLQAALAGNASAMVAFARLEGVTMAGLVADPALYEQYRLHAFGLWERALHQGSMDALWLWYGAVNDGWQKLPLFGVLPPEYRPVERPLALIERVNDAGRLPASVHMQQMISSSNNASRPPISISSEAREWADAFYRRHLEASTELVLADARQRLMLDHFSLIGEVKDLQELAARSEELEATAYNERCSSTGAD
ncbi:MAG: hypothetical protein KDI56_03325 [Xanthomonadales bacterium]|nr:hypothetical protein [Xanthomonadales bacterium]